MTTAGGGWTLASNRRGGTANINVETCGATLADFFTGGCGSATAIGFGDSYALARTTRLALAYSQVFVVQYDSTATADTDDAYILDAGGDLFPNTNLVQQIPVTRVCDINGANCDSVSVYWKYIGDYWFHSAMCWSGSSSNSVYRGNYGLCHDGAGDLGGAATYPASSLYGNRSGYDETKLWAHPNNAAAYQERIFVR